MKSESTCITEMIPENIEHLKIVVEKAELRASQSIKESDKMLTKYGQYACGSKTLQNIKEWIHGIIKTIDPWSPIFDGGVCPCSHSKKTR